MSFANYDELSHSANASASNVGYFNLKNAGDYAYVRLPYASTSDFDIVPTHLIKVNGLNFNPRVRCLRRDRYDSADSCPVCSKGGKFTISFGPSNAKEVDSSKIEYRMYVRMLVYTKNPSTGRYDVQAQTWERPWKFGDDIKSKIEDYGDLKNVVFKIKRLGSGTDTRYELNKMDRVDDAPVSEALFPSKWELFDNFNVVGDRVWDKSYNELTEFVTNGNFPMRTSASSATNNTAEVHSVAQPSPVENNPSLNLKSDLPFDEFGSDDNAFNYPKVDTTVKREVMPWDE